MAGEKARVTALDIDVDYGEMMGHVTAAQMDLTHSEMTAQVTAVEALCTETLLGTAMPDFGARLAGVEAVVTRAVHHMSTFATPISRTLRLMAKREVL